MYMNKTSTERVKRHWQKYPEKAVYNHLCTNAKRRDIKCTISFEDFMEVITGTFYMLKRGLNSDSLTIDRIDPNKGYEKGNLQVITLRENVKKQREYEYYEDNLIL